MVIKRLSGQSREHGFTLVEISIVLVIIGLLAGGILVGKDMIRAAELRADITLTREIATAVNTFKTKYNCLPGDCANITDFFPEAMDGDGNGVIGLHRESGGSNYSMMFPSIWNDEGVDMITANDHLARAGLIKMAPFDVMDLNNLILTDPGRVMPTLKSQNLTAGAVIGCKLGWLGVVEGCHYLLLGVTNASGVGLGTKPAVYSIPDAHFIDSKLDDGVALKGDVLSANSTDPLENEPQFVVTDGECDEYNFSSTDRCVLMVRSSF